MVLGSTQPLTEMNTRSLPGGKMRPGKKNVDLYIRSPIRLHGVVFNQLSTGKTLPYLYLKGRPARKFDNFTAICEPTVYKMWEPRRLTTQWAFTACYGDSFTFLLC
jgi:hypothetical protein